MNAIVQAQEAYGSRNSPLRTGRSIEIELITKVTSKLRTAVEKRLPYARLVEALHENRVMWIHFAASVADSENALPEDLRARLFYLAEFTDHQTRKILAGEANCAALIEINVAVIRGLGERSTS